jgi:deoxyribose-phosphate aldolase
MQRDTAVAGQVGLAGQGAAPGGADLLTFNPADVATSDAALRQLLHGLPGVDQVGAAQRAATLATRSIKRDAKLWALDTAVRMVDLTTLEGADTPGKVRGLCAKARQPDPADPAVPPVAAVCVYPDLVAVARSALRNGALRDGALAGSGVKVASVATAFPSGRASLAVKLADVADAVAAGADEVDMVIDRGAFLAGRYGQVAEEIRAVRDACGPAHLKVILETGELATLDNVARASWLAMLSGADFIKTSTGKVSPAATPPVTLVMLGAVADFAAATGRRVGVKVAGGVRTAKDAVRYLVLVKETAGPEWLTPELFRIGASSLLNDLLMQRRKQLTGVYPSPDYFSLD